MTYECAVCGKRQPADWMIFSRPTGRRYCRDVAACDRRAARAKACGRRVDAAEKVST